METYNKTLEKYKDLYKRYIDFEKKRIPLCAAENYISDFVKSTLISEWGGKYSLSNGTYFDASDFIGGEFLYELLQLTVEQCNKIFNAKYSNPKTLTGMNCFTVALMSCANICKNRRALITSPECGGHASIPIITSTIGFEIDNIPYDYTKFDIDYDKTNRLLKDNSYGIIIIALSDLLQQPDLNKLDIPKDTIIIYDATQTLGLIAAKLSNNPLLSKHEQLLLIGGTHKTLPGPSCGIIMSNNDILYNNIENSISPDFIRDFQPNNVVALLMTLIEAEEIGESYQKNIIWTANILGNKLKNKNINIASLQDCYTKTHQLFLKMDMHKMNTLYNNAMKYGVTLNKKHKRLFDGYGIRLGVQEIARFGWGEYELDQLSNLIHCLALDNVDERHIISLINELCEQKHPTYLL